MRPAPATERRKRRREGNVAMLTALTLTMMMMFVALSFDVGNIHRVRSEVQSGMDSAALAGAARLDGSASGITAAKNIAVAQANMHKAYAGALATTTSDVTVGTWNFTSGAFTPWNGNTDTATLAQQFAVKVDYRVPSVAHPFAAVMGNANGPVRALAVAVGGGPHDVGCAFPLVVPDCLLKAPDQSGFCGYTIINAPSTADNGGWTSYSGTNSQVALFNAVVAACTSNAGSHGGGADCDWDLSHGSHCTPTVDSDGQCIGSSGCSNSSVANDNQITVGNGNSIASSGQNDVCELIKDILRRGVAANAPTFFTVTSPVVTTGITTDCSPSPPSTSFTGSQTVGGYAKLDIYGVQCNSDAAPVYDTTHGFPVPVCPAGGGGGGGGGKGKGGGGGGGAAANVCIFAREHCNDPVNLDQLGGGGAFGIAARRRLVQ